MSGKLKISGRRAGPEDRTNPAIPHFDIQEWVKDGNKFVTRRELYDFIGRLERGRARAQHLHRRVGWALAAGWRRVWTYLRRSPLETEEQGKP